MYVTIGMKEFAFNITIKTQDFINKCSSYVITCHSVIVCRLVFMGKLNKLCTPIFIKYTCVLEIVWMFRGCLGIDYINVSLLYFVTVG